MSRSVNSLYTLDFNCEVKANMRLILLNAGVTQSEAARRMGIDKKFFSNISTGVNIDTLRKFCMVFDVTASEVLGF